MCPKEKANEKRIASVSWTCNRGLRLAPRTHCRLPSSLRWTPWITRRGRGGRHLTPLASAVFPSRARGALRGEYISAQPRRNIPTMPAPAKNTPFFSKIPTATCSAVPHYCNICGASRSTAPSMAPRDTREQERRYPRVFPRLLRSMSLCLQRMTTIAVRQGTVRSWISL